MGQNKPKTVTCGDCGTAFEIKYETWRFDIKHGIPFRCNECRKKHKAEINRQVLASKTEEERKASIEKMKATKAAKSPEEKALTAERKRQSMLMKSNDEKRARIKKIKISKSKRKGRYDKEVKCADCGKMFFMAYGTWWLNNKNGTPFRCPECSKKYRAEINRSRMANLSDEERIRIKEKQRATIAAKSQEERQLSIEKMKSAKAARSEEEKQLVRDKISQSWKNKSEEEKQSRNAKISEGQKRVWANKSNGKRETYRKRTRQRMAAMSDTDKQLWRSKISESNKRAWKHKTKSEKAEHGRNVTLGLLNRPLESKIATAEKQAKHYRDKELSEFPLWFENAFKSYYGVQYQLRRETVDYVENVHNWDYQVMKDNELIMLVDIDDNGTHGGGHKEYMRLGTHRGVGSEVRDSERGLTIPNDTPFMIISEECADESFKELTEVLGKPYDEFIQWKYQHLRNQPFPYPSYTAKELVTSYERLGYRLKDGRKTPGVMALDRTHWDNLYGQHMTYHFYHSIWHDHMPGKLCPHDAYMDNGILMDMIRKRYILHVRNRNKITQCFLLSEEAPRVPIFTPIMGMKVIHKYASDFDTICDCNTCYGGVLLASLAMDKKYVGYDSDLAHHNESNKLIQWFPTVGISVNAKMLDHVPSGPCMCSYVPFGDDYIDELLQRTNCSKYVLIVPNTDKYKDSIVETYTTDDHWGEHQWHIVIINK